MIAHVDPHCADSVLKSPDRFGPKLTWRVAGRIEKKKGAERKTLQSEVG